MVGALIASIIPGLRSMIFDSVISPANQSWISNGGSGGHMTFPTLEPSDSPSMHLGSSRPAASDLGGLARLSQTIDSKRTSNTRHRLLEPSESSCSRTKPLKLLV